MRAGVAPGPDQSVLDHLFVQRAPRNPEHLDNGADRTAMVLQGGLDRLVEQIDEQLAKSGLERVEAVH